MTAHVAEAGEQRGRVVLKLGCTEPSQVALEAAIRIAQAFQSEIETLFVEEPGLYEAAKLPFVREVSLTGRVSHGLDPVVMARQMRHVAEVMMRRVEALARSADVPTRSTFVRDEPLHAMAAACHACGPWNVLALTDCNLPRDGADIRRLFDRVTDMTGVVFAGPKARTASGAVVVAVEDAAHIEPLIRAAHRLAPTDGGVPVRLLLIADDEARLDELEGQVRLALGPESNVEILRAAPAHGSGLGPAEALRRLGCGLIIAELGGRLVPANGDLGHLNMALECPILVVR